VTEKEMLESFIEILRLELVPATGCTEPIAIAYCAAKLRDILEGIPERIKIEVSGNILKNAKSVLVPGTGGLKGILAAVSAGVIAGDANRELQVIFGVPEEKHEEIKRYLETALLEIIGVDTDHPLDICLTGYLNGDCASVHILDGHSNIAEIVKNGKTTFNAAAPTGKTDISPEYVQLSVERILQFADTVPVNRIATIFDRQIAYNCAIAEEGLRGDWGVSIGKMLWKGGEADAKTEAMAYAAAGSDARMGGCEMPVVILSGSGNQGITASLPVIRYAQRIGANREKLLRALAVSALVTIHQKSGIGKLSAYCGAVSAGVGAGAGIAYLLDGSYDAVAHAVVNAIAILSGTICDGAKPSCAAKIAFAVEAGILGYEMYCNDKQFYGGDGIVAKGADNTIANIGILAKDGMRETDRTIIGIMTRC